MERLRFCPESEIVLLVFAEAGVREEDLKELKIKL